MEEAGARFTVAEVGGADAEREMKLFTAPGRRLDSAYGFDFLYADRLSPELVRGAMATWPATPETGWPSWAFENHDAPRAVSRWAPADAHDAFARVKMLLLASLRGNIFLYNGEELGLGQVDIPFEALQDPEAIANWPLTLSRDGARTPIPWRKDAAGHGFTAGTPWLPFGEENVARAVDVQEGDPGSLLNWTREVLALRNSQPALRRGALAMIDAPAGLLAFERLDAGQQLLCVFNLGDEAIDWALPMGWTPIAATGTIAGEALGGWTGMIAQRDT
jgi:alpha-glucosidase